MQGWIKLHRQLCEHELWTCEPFSRGQAWVDLLMLANHEDGFFYLRDHKINVKRGQVGWSILKLSQRWRWSRSKVTKFVNDLEKEQQLIQQQSHSSSILTIVNYEQYQEKEQQDIQQKDNRKTTERQQKDTNKNDKNYKNEKNEKNNNIIYSNDFLKFWNVYKRHDSKVEAYKSFKKCKIDDIDFLVKAVEYYNQEYAKKNGSDLQYYPMPTTYLNQKRYLDYEDKKKVADRDSLQIKLYSMRPEQAQRIFIDIILKQALDLEEITQEQYDEYVKEALLYAGSK